MFRKFFGKNVVILQAKYNKRAYNMLLLYNMYAQMKQQI